MSNADTLLGQVRQARSLSRAMLRGDAFRLAFCREPAAVESVHVPTAGGMVHLRPATIDLRVFEKVFLDLDYAPPLMFAWAHCCGAFLGRSVPS